MTNPIIREHNSETDQVIDREMTDQEFKDYKNNLNLELKRNEDLIAKNAIKAAIAERLGLTPEEMAALLA